MKLNWKIVFFGLVLCAPLVSRSQCSANAGADQAICAGQQVLLGGTPTASGGSGVYSYDWSGPSVSDVANPTVSPTVTTTYTVTVDDGNGCVTTDSVTITVTALPVLNGGPDLDPCLNSLPITLPTPPGAVWTGAPANMLTPGGVFTPSQVGFYILTITLTQNGCTATDNVTIQVRPLPTVNAGADQTICQGQTVQLGATASSPNGAITLYTWSGGAVSNSLSQNPTAAPATTTTYNVTAVDIEGCSRPDQVTVNVQPSPVVNAGPDLTLCNDPVPTALSGFTPSGGSWSGTGVTTGGVFTPPSTGTYVLTYSYTNPLSCSNSDTRTITVVAPGPIDAGADASSCVGGAAITLSPVTPGGVWSGSSWVTGSGQFTPSLVGTYVLTYSVAMGTCSSTDQVTVVVHDLPVVNAGMDQSVCPQTSVQLTGTASGGTGFSYTWSGPNGFSAQGVASTTVSSPSSGNYSFTATNSNGCSATDVVAVNVLAAPVVDAGQDIDLCDQPVPYALAAASPPGGAWSGSDVTPGGVFTPSGVGVVVLTYSYTDANGCISTDQLEVEVVDPQQIDAGPEESVCQNEGNLVLSATASAPGTWSGPGIIDPFQGIFDPVVAGPGDHEVTLTFGSGSCLVSDQRDVEVKPIPQVSAGPNEDFCQDEGLVSLTGNAPVNGMWSGVGLADTFFGVFDASNPAGTYTVSYSFTDPLTGCAETDSKQVTISTVPIAAFSVDPVQCVGSAVGIINSSSGANSWTWNFGEANSTVTGPDPAFTYTFNGGYTIQLTASNGDCSSVALADVQVTQPPVAQLGASPVSGCAPLAVTFSNASTGDDLAYSWDLSTTTSADAVPAPVVYLENGGETEYTVQLTASNVCGSSTDSEIIHIDPRPEASFSMSVTGTICSPVLLEFQNTCTGDPEDFFWDFGNGETSTVMAPDPMLYTTDDAPTTYDIWLYTENVCGLDSMMQSVTVQPNLVDAVFSTNVEEGCSPVTVTIDNLSEGATNYVFEVPGMGSVNQAEPDILFELPGTYEIILHADDGCGYDQASVWVDVLETPGSTILPGDANVCVEEDFSVSGTGTAGTTLHWDFGDGGVATGPSTNHAYSTAGSHTITLTAVHTNGCTATDSQEVNVHASPVPQFSVSVAEGCSPLEVCTDNSTTGAVSFSWDMGNGVVLGSNEPCMTYLVTSGDPMEVQLSLTATNAWACSATTSLPVVVYPAPAANLLLDEAGSCAIPGAISASGALAGDEQASWTVNGIPVSAEPTLEWVAMEIGSYQVGLTVTNNFGCSSEATATYEVYAPPVAAFQAEPTEGCMDLDVFFDNQSTNAVGFEWHFDDGQSSSDSDVLHVFDEQGVYDIILVATSADGCRDTLELNNHITVFDRPVAAFSMSTLETSIYYPEIVFTNESEGADSYVWNFGDGQSAEGVHPVYSYLTPGTWPVTLTAYNQFGCEDREVQYVRITNEMQVFIPNGFTPDGDGINDVFRPVMAAPEFVRFYHLQIWDRWGVMVFESHDPNQAWTGNIRGGDHYGQTNAYNYRLVIEGEENSETQVYTGTITMAR